MKIQSGREVKGVMEAEEANEVNQAKEKNRPALLFVMACALVAR
jgi:hypothetical protein